MRVAWHRSAQIDTRLNANNFLPRTNIAAAVQQANPYAQMAELPYPAANGPGAYAAQDTMAPSGFKVPLGGVPRAPAVPAAATSGAAAVAAGLSNANAV